MPLLQRGLAWLRHDGVLLPPEPAASSFLRSAQKPAAAQPLYARPLRRQASLRMPFSPPCRRHPPSHPPCFAGPQVEATVSRTLLRIVGTAVGGSLGYVAMVHARLATNPYGLMAIICTFTFAVGGRSWLGFNVRV